jgi:hypothetical protein
VKYYRRIGFVWILVLFVVTPGLFAQSGDDLPLLEAVLRYEIGLSLRDSSPGATRAVLPFAFCVQIRASARAEPVDPDASLLARFRDDRPPVKPGSACDVKDWKVYDRSTGRPAVILDVGPVVRQRGSSRAEVSGAPYVGGQVARENLYRLKLRGKTWIVYDVRIKMVT